MEEAVTAECKFDFDQAAFHKICEIGKSDRILETEVLAHLLPYRVIEKLVSLISFLDDIERLFGDVLRYEKAVFSSIQPQEVYAFTVFGQGIKGEETGYAIESAAITHHRDIEKLRYIIGKGDVVRFQFYVLEAQIFPLISSISSLS